MGDNWAVEFGYRTDDGMGVSTPTHSGRVTVQAETKEQAIRKAIDAAYTLGPVISHVHIRSVENTTN